MRFFLITILIFLSFQINAQIEDFSRSKNMFIQDEISFGLKISTNGWGMDFRDGYFINMKRKKLYEIGFNVIHHPKEYKLASYHYLTKSFVFGKMNECFDIKAAYGQQFLLFDKKEPGSIAINFFVLGGIDLALLKPIYYSVLIDNYGNTDDQLYQSNMQPALITQKASFSKGLSELKINPGIYIKLGTSFEHSKQVNVIQNLELGIESYFFLNNLEIMGDIDNPRFITSLFISYRIGSLIKNRRKEKDKK